jgi:ketosteroid isomerase-like protein
MTSLPLACLALAFIAAAGADAQPLRAADLALDRAAADRDRAAFAALLTADTYWAAGGAPNVGPEAVLRDWDDLFQPGGPSLRWAPDRAELSAAGDLGFTVGTWRLTARDAAGAPVQRTGQYVTVWTRGEDGRYRVAVDLSHRPPAGSTADLVRTPDRRAAAASGDLRIEAGRYTRAAGPETGVYLVVVRTGAGGDEVLVETLVPARPAK